ncbi:Gfo/Idh/MocA family protein [Aeromicrobium camelliae]|uniref:Gfo/Idh/MocA family protein n=1 Tax=Aeromicrobium camelliae TaxID=1538144 RepID=UPI001AA0631C|nr:Gfo/Idh/MocA family oxidoreductase [Aeromicrobium camelliae]
MEPLRIGVLGTARITDLALVAPAKELGIRLVAVAARDRDRATDFAARHGIERVLDHYAALVSDAEVEVVYNPLVNAWHGPWNRAALEAGKHVLSEKPSAANADEAASLREVAAGSGRHLVEAFHYAYHPLIDRVLTLIDDGAVGTVTGADIFLVMPPPEPWDARWSYDLAGGALMDLGCYALHLARLLTPAGAALTVTEARATEAPHDPRVDSRSEALLRSATGAEFRIVADMTADRYHFAAHIRGSRGHIDLPAFIWPHADDRLILHDARTGRTVTERLGTRSSYTYQLEALRRLVRDGVPMLSDADDAVTTMQLIDATYRRAGLPPRPTVAAVSDPRG